ncbi:MAG: hypothetical protein M4579_005398 [Chaenotheca gracillima]|nr:MAG: hypothetical protein M4579_005398 [Chaenotheca gracillima]
MAKRRIADEVAHSEQPNKRLRRGTRDHISPLSDELLLRILSNLPVATLALCQQVSHRFHSIGGDSQLWKSAYYNRFVRPRALRIPGISFPESSPDNFVFSSHRSRWLGDESLLKQGKEVDWKRQYKLRHNWSRGSCDTSQIRLGELPVTPPLLVQLQEELAFTVDGTSGLRVWDTKADKKLLAAVDLKQAGEPSSRSSNPTSLAVDCSAESTSDVCVGFGDGHFSIYRLNRTEGIFQFRHSHPPSLNGTLTALAFSSPYLLTMTERQLLSIYTFAAEDGSTLQKDTLAPPRLLSSLKSHTVWPPLSLSIRSTSSQVVASIAFAIPTFLSGWSVGLQELQFTAEGEITQSRLTTAVNQGFTPLTPGQPTSSSSSPSPHANARGRRGLGSILSSARPTSLSYSHPYLLVSHPDNTLTLYLVSSTSAELSISEGSRLWGHTSSVSGVAVGGRGKAVSVSMRGEELRVWELEGGFRSATSKRKLDAGQVSVQIRPEPKREEAGTDSEEDVPPKSPATPTGTRLALQRSIRSLDFAPGWIGFDEERVIVLREEDQGNQNLVVYDFT